MRMLSLVLLFLAFGVSTAHAASEAQVQYGNLNVPAFAGGGTEPTTTFTYQYAGEWKYGDAFFFSDFLFSPKNGFNDTDVYAELNVRWSAEKTLGKRLGLGPVRDSGLFLGFNYAADPNVFQILPGASFFVDIPGFAFVTVDLMYYIDASKGAASGGAPKESNAWMANVGWLYPFTVNGLDVTVQGYAEYLASRTDEFGTRLPAWYLTQPQVRWEVNDSLALGIEYSLWFNKLGDKTTTENAVQALAVWKF